MLPTHGDIFWVLFGSQALFILFAKQLDIQNNVYLLLLLSKTLNNHNNDFLKANITVFDDNEGLHFEHGSNRVMALSVVS